MEKVIFEQDNRTYLVVDKNNEVCPICGASFKGVYFTWNTFHGEGSASCCHAPYQLKSFYIDNVSDECKTFVENIGKDDKIVLSIDEKYIDPCKRAIKETGIYNINDRKVFDLAMEYSQKGENHEI